MLAKVIYFRQEMQITNCLCGVAVGDVVDHQLIVLLAFAKADGAEQVGLHDLTVH
jgi:hypothetical protein